MSDDRTNEFLGMAYRLIDRAAWRLSQALHGDTLGQHEEMAVLMLQSELYHTRDQLTTIFKERLEVAENNS